MRFFRPCFVAGWLFPQALFRVRTTEKVLYLTFDDGPNPHYTMPLLDLLDSYSVKAVFFCNGMAAEKYPEIVSQIRSRGHITGNHGYYHMDGWRFPAIKYIENASLADSYSSPSLFRPPYGHISMKQYKMLREKYKIIFWDIMPYDFDRKFGADNALQVLKNKLRPGSIIALHDTDNSMADQILQDFIPFALKAGYRFDNVLPG